MYGLGLGSRHIPMQIQEPSQSGGGGPGRISTQPVRSADSRIEYGADALLRVPGGWLSADSAPFMLAEWGILIRLESSDGR